MALVAATLVLDGKTCNKLRLAAAGIGDRAQRIRAVEALLEGKEVGENMFGEAASIAHDAVEPLADGFVNLITRANWSPCPVELCLQRPMPEAILRKLRF
jgi:CO/xanthine dehydrogenase FAD-binding subunit